MIDRVVLLADLKPRVTALEADLGRQVKAVAEVGSRLRAEYDQARNLGRTAATWNAWLEERITQVAVAWVLGTVFVRFCEDNGLIPEPYLAAGTEDGRELVQARYDHYVETDSDPTYRGWLERAFAEVGEGQAGKLLFDKRHNPLYQIPISHEGARELIEFWRERDEESGQLVRDFTDPLSEDGTRGWDTRFLGDLYQDLSEAARKTYALLQTPEFVEEFILDRTMDPAVREFGFEGLKMIDPTCGSGHFVLGAFRRLVRLWRDERPGVGTHERVRKALESVHGVDINPFAIAIARFRLLVAAMAASGVRSLKEAQQHEWPIQLAVGDSLIKARQMEIDLFGEKSGDALADFAYATEDKHEYPGILEPGTYHVVVGNPPYVTVKDRKLNEAYREMYSACSGKYALSVPFAQRFFELAKRGDAEGHGWGMVGQITASSFMKREFGTKLIEEFFAHKTELMEVIDTSGAYIPGHGTPTVIIIGRPRSGMSGGRIATVRTVRSVQGEPSAPEDGSEGLVWRAIVAQINKPGSVSRWVSVEDLERDRYFAKHPWILTDGGLEMVEQLADSSRLTLGEVASQVGISAVTGEDDLYLLPLDGCSARKRVERTRLVVTGDVIRDYRLASDFEAVWVYDSQFLVEPLAEMPMIQRYLWPYFAVISKRRRFGTPMLDRGFTWYEWQELYAAKLRTSLSITFAFVATHNHFVLDRGGKIFKQSALVVKLSETADEQEYLRLLGVLNSSAAALWMKMSSHNMGSTVDSQGARQSTLPFEDFFQFNGRNIERFPLPTAYPIEIATRLDALAQQLAICTPSATADSAVPTAARLREARAEWESIRARMIALQEELDWQVYAIYNLHPEDLRTPTATSVPELALGERAFEIVLASRVAAGEASGEWFKRHNSTPITAIPEHWPAEYRATVQKRIDAIESSRAIGMIERPEYKRRWATEGWDALQQKALRSWLLDRIESREYWFDENDQPMITTLSRLTDALSRDTDFASVAALYAPRNQLAATVSALLTDEHVPFLAALRYKPSGLKKRQDWEDVWDLQRQEDAAPDEPTRKKIRDSIPVPPKYTSADFLRTSYWQARGKLDVPKERFISYGQTNAATPVLYGWAGWDHREQAQALATYFTNTPLSTEEITPFLAGLLELQPWLTQWHNEFDPIYGGSPADFFSGYRLQKQGEHGLTDADLRAWRPAAARRGRARTSTAA